MRFPIKISTKKLRFPIKQGSQKVRFPIISTAKKVRFPKNLCLNKAYTKSFDKNSSQRHIKHWNTTHYSVTSYVFNSSRQSLQAKDVMSSPSNSSRYNILTDSTLHCIVTSDEFLSKLFHAFCRWLFLILVDSIRLWSWNKLTLTLICHQTAHGLIYFVHSAFSPSFVVFFLT